MQLGPRAWLAEFVGTFALVFVGSMTAAMGAEGFGGGPAPGVVVPALGHGLVLVALVYALGAVSGCHINPAVTISLAAIRRFPLAHVAPYLGAQIAGGIVGGLFHFLTRAKGPSEYGLTMPAAGVGEGTVFLLEAVLTFLLVTAIVGAAVSGKAPAGFHGLAIGLTLGAAILVGGALTGASLNPARTLGPAVFAQNFTAHWAYWAGPIIGGLAAAVVGVFVHDLRPEST